MGALIGYATTALPQLQDELLTQKEVLLNEETGSWFVSIGLLMGIFTCPLGGWLGGYLGRKKMMLLTSPVIFAGWAILGTANTRSILFFGRILSSIAQMCQISSPGNREKIIHFTINVH